MCLQAYTTCQKLGVASNTLLLKCNINMPSRYWVNYRLYTVKGTLKFTQLMPTHTESMIGKTQQLSCKQDIKSNGENVAVASYISRFASLLKVLGSQLDPCQTHSKDDQEQPKNKRFCMAVRFSRSLFSGWSIIIASSWITSGSWGQICLQENSKSGIL